MRGANIIALMGGKTILPANVNYFCAMQKRSMEELGRLSVEEFRNAAKFPVAIVLENIRSAYNVGSVFRTSDAFLIEKIHLVGYCAKPPHKEIRKTALGAEETVDWEYFSTCRESIEQLKAESYKIYAVEQARGSVALQEFDWAPEQKIAVIFGNEVSGVEQSTITLCDGCIEIPQYGMKHSLNIATAAGVVLWELVRKKMNIVR
jgi:tRNA G18 (ribose-2'-O)-methylase SpoU